MIWNPQTEYLFSSIYLLIPRRFIQSDCYQLSVGIHKFKQRILTIKLIQFMHWPGDY